MACTNPSTPSRITSRVPAASDTTTAVRDASASSTTLGHPSDREGNTNTSQAA